MSVYYNEIDPYAAQWLRNLIDAGHIAPGVVDTRSIEDVIPSELAGFTQCHFFAGIGGWPLALRLAGWPDDRPVWTGSCPCQPFSAAGKGAGFADERHLWPAWQHLIAQCWPAVVFGEQVASKAVDSWIDLVHADLEGMGYAFGCVPFPSAGVGAPHIRDRTFWVGVGLADANHPRLEGWGVLSERATEFVTGPSCMAGRMGNADSAGSQPGQFAAAPARHRSTAVADGGVRGLADSHSITGGQGRAINGARHQGGDAKSRPGLGGNGQSDSVHLPEGVRLRVSGAGDRSSTGQHGMSRAQPQSEAIAGLPIAQRTGPTNGLWRDADWLACTDGKWRPVEPGTFPLVDGSAGRVGRMRAYGNAIVPQVAAEFIQAFLDVEDAQSVA